MSAAERYPDLLAFLASTIAEADLEGLSDAEAVRRSVTPASAAWHRQVLAQGRAALADPDLPWRTIADHANRNLESPAAVRAWLACRLADLAAALAH